MKVSTVDSQLVLWTRHHRAPSVLGEERQVSLLLENIGPRENPEGTPPVHIPRLKESLANVGNSPCCYGVFNEGR